MNESLQIREIHGVQFDCWYHKMGNGDSDLFMKIVIDGDSLKYIQVYGQEIVVDNIEESSVHAISKQELLELIEQEYPHLKTSKVNVNFLKISTLDLSMDNAKGVKRFFDKTQKVENLNLIVALNGYLKKQSKTSL